MKMKKIFLSIILMFAMITFANANSVVENNSTDCNVETKYDLNIENNIDDSVLSIVYRDCFSIADEAATNIGNAFNLSFEDEYYVFEAIYDACNN